MSNAAIQLDLEAYDAAVPRPMGRHSAGEGFLRGFLKHADVERFVLWNVGDRPTQDLEALLDRLGPPTRPVDWLGRGDRPDLATVGAVYAPSPVMSGEAWARRGLGSDRYSLTGVTHTIAETYILDELASLLTAPFEPWDALICTSESVRRAVETLLDGVAEYLQDRFAAARIPPAQLVTIPLGVHTADFTSKGGQREAWRQRLDIPDDAPVVLHMGRLSLQAKLHPGPSGLALQQAAERLGRPIYWLIFGAGRSPKQDAAFLDAAAAFAPDVRIRLAPGADAATRNEIISAADVFLSLSDNVQETFGLTPVEAMAAGLPCVVSDWDGYRDTVRHGVDGVRIRTLQPAPGLGADLIYGYAHRLMSYEDYVGSAALLAAVDVREAADAVVALLDSAELRQQMGAAGRARAQDVFDWRAIIPQYQALWGELARRRSQAPSRAPLDNPYRPDPFRMFSDWATAALGPDDRVELAGRLGADEIAARLLRPEVRHPAARLPEMPEVRQMLTLLQTGPATVAQLLASFPAERRPFLERGLLWLAKFDLLRLQPRNPRN